MRSGVIHPVRARETRRKKISAHKMLQQPQIKACDEHTAGIHSKKGNPNYPPGTAGSHLGPATTSLFHLWQIASPLTAFPAKRGRSNRVLFFRAGEE